MAIDISGYRAESFATSGISTGRDPGLAPERILAVIVLCQLLVVIGLRFLYPDTHPIDPLTTGLSAIAFLGVVVPICVILICFCRVVQARPEGSATAALIREIRPYVSDRRRLRNGLPVLAIFIPFMALFAHFKVNIPAMRPFSWDATFTAWDRTIFLGDLPYQWLSLVMSHPLAIFLTSAAYTAWFFIMCSSFLACAFMTTKTELRTHYLIAFFLVWLVEGNFLALVFSSAGPCYYALLGLAPDPYQPLMAALHHASLSYPMDLLSTQQRLWSGYIGEGMPVGISAMPSVHNGVAVLMALAAWQVSRSLGIVFAVYAFWIFVGSISLAWHYAVDGLVALPVTLAIWVVSGLVARWWHGADARTFTWFAIRPAAGLSNGSPS
ncbi:phosphatase PAP2 family protein [Aurantimonas sp. HBX-1]|uniref:phosphatase PAP2 family protein n=1 Tax=Aurantimonas sp. HBX-1 TaxID=2906072 RepID=UPI001F2C113A|nr:phosphatase PAP2 family protein [Aurantimonas sp. HBX-1]UIJ71798.1 phosphatase PAP2 family protein [Aurantimonas sp. HBX-1]